MLLCPADVEETRSQEISRPLEVTSLAIDNVDVLIAHWFKVSVAPNPVEVALEKKSPDGDGNGVGAVWGVTYIDKSTRKPCKQLVEVKQFFPNQRIVLVHSAEPTPGVGSDLAVPPTYLTFTAVGKGESTEVTVKMANTISSTLPGLKVLLYLPCFWPHLLLLVGCLAVDHPCCKYIATSTHKQNLAVQCERGLSAIKSAVEKGPQQQVMSDTPPPYQVAAPLATPPPGTSENPSQLEKPQL